jgi:ABC-type dipeptide/oligopeptide/nickel transport system permease subunit
MSAVENAPPFVSRRRVSREVMQSILAQPSGSVGLVITTLIVLVAVLAPWIAPWPPLETHYMEALSGPTAKYWLGTDEVGRDVLSRIIFGTQPSLAVALTAVMSGGTIGIVLGIAAGYYRGWFDALVMRICDIAFAFPLILIGICTVIILGPSIVSVGIAVGIGVMPSFARLARAEVLEEMDRDFVKASRGMGGTDVFIVIRHIIPNIAATLVVQLASAVSGAVVIASALDFLGIGTQPPMPSWGNMLQASRLYLNQNPSYALAPGIALTIFVIGINILAAALTNALDPRIRTEILKGRRT